MKQARLQFRARSALVPWILLAFLAALQLVPPADARAAEHTVVIQAMAFTPAVLEVKRGDTVVWVNRDFFPHTATAPEGAFDSGAIAAAASWRYVADRQGRFDYVCTLHPTMKAVLVVE